MSDPPAKSDSKKPDPKKPDPKAPDPRKPEPKPPVESSAVEGWLPEEIGGFNEQCLLFQMAGPILQGMRNNATFAGAPSSKVFPYDGDKPGSGGTTDSNVMNVEDFGPQLTMPGGTRGVEWQDPGGDMNYMFVEYLSRQADKKLKNFLEITPNEASQLIPNINIGIEYKDGSGKRDKRSFWFDFPNHTKLDLLQSSGRRKAAGIQDITIRHEGIDTATDKFVIIDSTFIFQDFRTLTKGLSNAKTLGRSYGKLLELGNHTFEKSKKGNKQLHKTTLFEFGYSGTPAMAQRFPLSKLKSRVEAELFKYSFDFKEDGSIIVKTTHRGIMHTVFGSKPWANILSYAREEEARIREQGAITIADAKNRLKQTNNESLTNRTLERLAIRTLLEMMEASTQRGPNWHLGQPASSATTLVDFAGGGGAYWTTPAKATVKWEAFELDNFTKHLVGSAVRPKVGVGGLDKQAVEFMQRYAMTTLENAFRAHDSLRHHVGTTPGKGSMGAATMAYVDTTAGKDDFQSLLEWVEAFRKRLDQASDVIENNLDPQVITKNAQAAVAAQMALLRYISLQKIAEAIKNSNKVYYGGLTEEQRIALVTKKGTDQVDVLFHGSEAISGLGFMKQAANLTGGTAAAKRNLSKPETHGVPFVFLGEFLEAILRLPFSNKKPTKTFHDGMKDQTGIDLQLALGTCTFDPPYTGAGPSDRHRNINFPMYYLPLSLNKVNEFITREVIGKEKTSYAFGEFVRQLFQKYITPFFSSCRRVSKKGQRNIVPKFDFAFGYNKALKKENFFIYDSKTFAEGYAYFGQYSKNLARQIPHFYLGGPDRGIATDIKLQDIADGTLKAAVFYMPSPAGDGSLHGATDPKRAGWAPVVFQADVKMLGYPLIKLGKMVFIDARNIIPKKHSRVFEATGYYAIKKIVHKLTPSSFTTEVFGINTFSQAKFERQKAEASGAKKGKSTGGDESKSEPTGESGDKAPDSKTDASDGEAAPSTSDESDANSREEAKNILSLNKALDKTTALVEERFDFSRWHAQITLRKADSAGKGEGQTPYAAGQMLWSYHLEKTLHEDASIAERFKSAEGILCRVTDDVGLDIAGESAPRRKYLAKKYQAIKHWGTHLASDVAKGHSALIPRPYAKLVYEGKVEGDPLEKFIKREMAATTGHVGPLKAPPLGDDSHWNAYHPTSAGDTDNPDWDWD